MAYENQRTFWQLRVGIMVVISLLILTVSVVLVSGGGQMFKEKIVLKAHLPRVGGLKPGAMVWLSGVDVGRVTHVGFDAAAPEKGILVVMEVNAEVLPQIHQDATVQVGTIGLLGDKYIEVDPGSLNLASVAPGQELAAQTTSDLEKFSNQAQTTLAQLNQLTQRLDHLLQQLDSGHGSAGKFLNDPGIATALEQVLVESRRFLRTTNTHNGLARRMTSDEVFAEHVTGTLASFDTLARSMVQAKGSLGRMMADSTLYLRMVSTSARLDSLLYAVQKGHGLVATLLYDEQYKTEVLGLIGDVRALIQEFRQNPGKFVNLSLF